jgi:hypothetical protein
MSRDKRRIVRNSTFLLLACAGLIWVYEKFAPR